MQARIIGETEAHQEELLGEAYLDCQETVWGILRQKPHLLTVCRNEKEASDLRRAVDAVREGWLAIDQFLKPIVARFDGMLFSDLQPEEEARIRELIDEVHALVDEYQQVCWEIGTSSL